MKFQADYFDNNVIYEMGMMLCFVLFFHIAVHRRFFRLLHNVLIASIKMQIEALTCKYKRH